MQLAPMIAFHVHDPDHNGEWLVCLWPVGSSRSWIVGEFLSRKAP